MQLTPRADKIIRILLRFSPDSPVTIGIISEELGVSDRSVQRELPTVEKWMKHNGFCFVRKRSVGLLIDETPERLKELAALLDEKDTNSSAPADNRPERLTLLCHDLLLAEEPIKSYYFTEKFEISEGTLTADLNQLETWFTKYQLKLVRRPGLGVFIEGTEIARRQALTSFICKQVNEHHSIGNLQDKKFLSDRNFINEIDGEVMAEVNHILGGCQKQLGMQLSDNGYLHLLVYTSLCVQRMQKGRFIKELKQSYAEISIQPEYAVSEYIMKELRQFFHLSISVDETIYMAVFISGQRIWPSGSRDLTDIKNLDVHQITLSIIKKVNEILHINFMRDSRLLTELSGHIQPTIARLRAGIPVENPLLKEFQESYSSVYKACEEGLSLLCPILGIKKVPASEIGFITLYFTMAMERIEKEIKKLSVIIVCPTGIGSSRLLTESLKKEYPDLDIRGITSAFELDNIRLQEEGVDLVISTVKLEIAYPYIHVNPILTRQDKILLDSRIKVIQEQKRQAQEKEIKEPEVPSDSSICRKDVEFLSAIGSEIYELLGNIYINQAPILKNRDEIISYCSSLYADTSDMQAHLYKILKDRDNLADTYIKPFQALLLHGRSTEISTSCFGYVRLEPPIYERGHIIRGAIVSLIPSGPASEVAAPVTSEVIGALLEEPALLKALQSLNKESFTKQLEEILLRFYKSTVQTRLHLKTSGAEKV